jgi:integrase
MARQRGAHEGNIRQRPDGRWEARIDFGYENGKRDRRSYYGATRAEVAEQLVKMLRDKQQGIVTTPSKQTTKAYLTEWLEQAKSRVKPRTHADYQCTLQKHAIPYLGSVRVSKLTPQRLQGWLRALQADGVSANRCRYARTVLRAALKQATRWQVLAINPATLVEVPRHDRAEIQPLDVEQAQQLLKAARGHALEGFVNVALALGLREGEALALQWSDVDLDGRTLTVRRNIGRVPGQGLVFDVPKSKRSRRTLTLPTVVVDALKAHRARQKEQRLAAGPAWEEHGLVFTSPIGTPIDDGNLRKEF